jgi:hypothetical protein
VPIEAEHWHCLRLGLVVVVRSLEALELDGCPVHGIDVRSEERFAVGKLGIICGGDREGSAREFVNLGARCSEFLDDLLGFSALAVESLRKEIAEKSDLLGVAPTMPNRFREGKIFEAEVIALRTEALAFLSAQHE